MSRRELAEGTKKAIQEYIAEKEALLSPCATKSAAALRRYNSKPEDIRAPFSRDTDRIIHTRAYARYIDKTQVFSFVDNDHITHRVLHVQLVSKIARTIGRSLRLNEDLIEAIALGHDIGHAPYGHTGEEALSSACTSAGIGPFRHNVQGVRFLQLIEARDLTLQVLDGILCHNGETNDEQLCPECCPDWAAFDARVGQVDDDGTCPPPSTPEGCAVRFADTIAYLSRDIQDAREVNLLDDGLELPGEVEDVLGPDHPAIVDTLIKDLVEQSFAGRTCALAYSPEVSRAVRSLKAFNYRNIYENEKVVSEKPKIRAMFCTVFEHLLDDLQAGRKGSVISTDFMDTPWISRRYVERADPREFVRDFIAGMTDRYFEKTYLGLVVPQKVRARFP